MRLEWRTWRRVAPPFRLLMSATRIYQIYYSEATRGQLDPGFRPLDNLDNPRPDWREYWPIRKFLLDNPPEGDGFIGFFSPKFREKTGLGAAEVKAFIAQQPADTDVILFSPFFDQIAAYWSIFEHGMNHHPGIFQTFQLAADKLLPGLKLENLPTDSRNTVFSNYFVARPAFWREWLRNNEVLFAAAETGKSALGKGLNASVKYDKAELAAKVFMMERMATLMLATNPAWRVQVRDPLLSPIDPLFQDYRMQLVCMDALKIAFGARDCEEYRAVYRVIRNQMAQHSRATHDARMKARAGGKR